MIGEWVAAIIVCVVVIGLGLAVAGFMLGEGWTLSGLITSTKGGEQQGLHPHGSSRIRQEHRAGRLLAEALGWLEGQ